MAKKIEISSAVDKERAKFGLEDAGHNILRCSNCSAPLVDIWITNPKIDIQWKVRAECCHCGDKSFESIIHGQFHRGPAYVDKQGNYDENGECFTALDEVITDDEKEIIIFNTSKVRKWK